MSHPLLYVRLDKVNVSDRQVVDVEYVEASPSDIGQAAEKLGWVNGVPVVDGRSRQTMPLWGQTSVGWLDREGCLP